MPEAFYRTSHTSLCGVSLGIVLASALMLPGMHECYSERELSWELVRVYLLRLDGGMNR